MVEHVQIDLDRDGCMDEGTGFRVSINSTNAEGYGTGYRIAGPKFCSLGNNEHIATAPLNERDARAIFGHIRPLLGDDWLRDQIEDRS